MIESIEKKYTPEGCNPFMWICKYDDGKYVEEFESDGKENSFTKIEKDKVSELHLIGNGFHSMFDVKDGCFVLNEDTKVEFVIILGENKKLITSIPDELYNDIIQYKGFYTDGVSNLNDVNLVCHTCSYHIGWKKQFTIDENTSLFFKAILSVVIGKGIKFEIKLSSNNDFDANFKVSLITNGDRGLKEYIKKISLHKNKSCNFNINLS